MTWKKIGGNEKKFTGKIIEKNRENNGKKKTRNSKKQGKNNKKNRENNGKLQEKRKQNIREQKL